MPHTKRAPAKRPAGGFDPLKILVADAIPAMQKARTDRSLESSMTQGW